MVTLKLSAAKAGAFGLNSNQIGFNTRMFVLHDHLIENMWFHESSVELV